MILISSVYHDHAFQAIEQILNYHFFFGNKGVQVIHISASAPGAMVASLKEGIRDLIEEGHAVINPTRLNTVPASCLPQHCVNFEFARETLGVVFTHVYIHTSGDLLVNGRPAPYIQKNNYGLRHSPLNAETKWPSTAKALSSPILDAVSNHLYYGRAEGSFFPTQFFREALSTFHDHDGMKTFLDPDKSWPIEEVLFATLFKATLSSQANVFNLIRTKKLKFVDRGKYEDSKIKQPNMVSVVDIKNLITNSRQQPAGIKWFGVDPEDEARRWLRKHLQSIAPPESGTSRASESPAQLDTERVLQYPHDCRIKHSNSVLIKKMPNEKQLQSATSELLDDIHYLNQANKAEIKQVNTQIRQCIDEADVTGDIADAIIKEISGQLGQLSARVELADKAIRSISREHNHKPKVATAKRDTNNNSNSEKANIQFSAEQLAGGSNLLPIETAESGISYVWSSSDPEIHFTFSLDRSKSLGIQFRLYSLIKPEYSNQLKILIDGTHIKHWFGMDDGLFVASCNLPPSNESSQTKITILLPATYSPLELGASKDGRKLGIAIHEIRFGKPESGFDHLLKRLRLSK